MKNKEIEKILRKMKDEESEKVIAYINKLEKDFAEEEKECNDLFRTNRELTEEREKIIEYIKSNINALSTFYSCEKDERTKRMMKRKITIYRDILEKYK